MKTFLRLCVPLLVTTLACAFAQKIIFPPAPTPEIPPASQTPSPAPTTTPTEVYTPTPEVICSDDNCLNACLDRLHETLEKKPVEPIGKSIYEDEGEEFDLVIYTVNGDEITDPRVPDVPSEYRKYQQDTEAHLRIWNFYIAVIPPELRSTIKYFTIFTDGPQETTAWVSRIPFARDYSKVGFDLLDANYLPALADTLAHETAHLLTLNSSQMSIKKARSPHYDEKQQKFVDCEQYVADGHCSLPNSYINLFYQKFWKDIYAEWWQVDQEAQKAETSDEYWEIIKEKFYGKRSDWFLNSYASSSIEEDMAESFAYFVLHPRPARKWIYVQKTAFYYDFPELVEYRRKMIEGLCSYIQ